MKIESNGDELLVDSRIISEELGVQHKNLLETIKTHKSIVESEFGSLAFETDTEYQELTGVARNKCVHLTEDQAIFIGTLSRNSEQAVRFKIKLVKSFSAARKAIRELVKPKTPAEMLLDQAQMLVDHERKLSQIEEKVNYLIEDKENARQQLISLPLSGDNIPEETLRSKVVRLVNLYSRYTGLYQQDVWNKMYEQMLYRYHINIKIRKKIKGEKNNLDVAERLMCMDKLHALISKMVTDANVVVDYNY